MSHSKIILGTLLGAAIFTLAAQPAMAQSSKNNSARQYPQTSQDSKTGAGGQKKQDSKISGQNQGAPNKKSDDKNINGKQPQQGQNIKNKQVKQPAKNQNQQPPQQRKNDGGKNKKLQNSSQHQNNKSPQPDVNRKPNNQHKQQPYKSGLNRDRARDIAKAGHIGGYKSLPPDVKRNMIPGRPIPNHVEIRHVPPAMYDRLPRHDGYEWRIAGSDLILVVAGTLIIHEIIENVFS